MTVPSVTNQNLYSGTSSTTIFAYAFPISDEDHLRVVIADTDDVETVLTITTYYTVSGVGDSSGNVTLGDLTAICSQATLPTGWSLSIRRVVPLKQSTDLLNQGAYDAEDIEEALDYVTEALQQLSNSIDRAPQVAETSGETGAEYLTTIQGYVAASAASALTASTASTNAETAETNAETAETNAAASETAAGLSETAAGLSETAAGLSETAAELAEEHAETAETNAETAETNAAASALAASGSETASGLSQVAAGLSEVAAQLAETNAKTSETNAGVSAVSAAASAASLPILTGATAGQCIAVNAAKDGYDFVDLISGVSSLEDVTIASLADNEILQYDTATSKWKNEALVSGGITNLAKAYIGTAQTIDTTTAVANYDTEVYDTGSNFNTTTHRYTAPTNGIYNVIATVTIASVPDLEAVSLYLYLNTTLVSTFKQRGQGAGSGSDKTFVLVADVKMTAAQYLELKVKTLSSLDLSAGLRLGSICIKRIGSY